MRALLDEHGEAGTLDLGDHLLVFPGRRPARRTTELLVAEAERRGLVLTPPRPLTVGGLPERLYEPERPLADPILARRCWSLALRDLPRELLEPVVPEPPVEDDLAGWAGLAGIVHGLHRDVAAEGLDFTDVARRCRSEMRFDDSERWRVLSRVREAYLDRLAEANRSDADEARMRALREERCQIRTSSPPLRHLHLVGVVELPGLVRAMLREVGDDVEVVGWVHAPEERAHAFDELGCVDPSAWAEAHVPVDDEVLRLRNRPGDQASEVVRALASYGERYAADEVTVGVPDPSLAPWIEQRLSAHGVPHRLAAGTPLERTAPFRLLRAVADYLDGRRFPDLAALLRHPDVEELLERDGILETADRFFSKHLPARTEGALPTGSRAGVEMSALLERLSDDLLAPFHGRRRLTEWMPEVLGLLPGIYGDGALRRSRSRDRTILEACEQIRDAAAALHRLPEGADEACGAAAAIRVLLAELRGPDDAIPPEPERAAVEMLGWLELHLDDTPALILTGFNEGAVPESLSSHPFLPDGLRRTLGLPDNRHRLARDAYLLSALLHSRDSIRVVAGRTSASGDPLRPSRLLLTDRGEKLARRVLRLTGAEDGPAPAPLAPPELHAEGDSAFSAPPEPRLDLGEAPEAFAVTEFRTLLEDPYRWALERYLNLRELHDRDREMSAMAFGSLAHRILDVFAGHEEVGSDDPETVGRRLERILDRLVARRFGPGSLPAVPLQVEQLRHRLEAFAEWHARRIADGWRVLATEARTPEHGVPLDVDGRPVRLHGRIDRVDVHAESGTVAVFDYKTGDRARDPDRVHRTRSGAWRDLQLPLYLHLLPHLRDAEGAPLVRDLGDRTVRAGYIHLPKTADAVGEAVAPWDEELVRSAWERARAVVRRLREEPRVVFDASRVRSRSWDPLGPLLGRGVLALDDEPEEVEEA